MSGSVDFDLPLPNGGWRLRTLLDYSHAEGYRAELSRSTWIEDRDLVDLRISARGPGESWTLTLFALNLLDETYYSGMAVVGPAGTGVSLGLLAPPRTLGLTLQLRY